VTSPVFSRNRLKLGTFCTNGSGAAITLVPEAPPLSWAMTLEAARLADAAHFEAIVSYARWKGYDARDPMKPSGIVMDPFTWAAGIAQATTRPAIIATSHAVTIHPIVAARQLATIDLISNGRAALNVVAGWNRPELEMFGTPLKDHADRYDHLEEWVQVLLQLFHSKDEFDHHGEFFDLVAAISNPKPLQRPHPVLMNAGSSGRGAEFACKYADMCFVVIASDDPAAISATVRRYKSLARDSFDREVQVWTCGYVVQDKTVELAEQYLHRYAVEYADTESLDGWMRVHMENAKTPPEVVRAIRTSMAAGAGGFPLVGTVQTIADQLELLSGCGIDGVLLTWLDYVAGLQDFTAGVLPLLEARGLRAPVGVAGQPDA
jgi:alkanesulfonate monooxygenase SsuD/methylene tetrahydromethanopterin reductase-like flavin-dependent oxidoreductase (luciferase family)